jgi:AbrB family looped-hinge helix DNA binding protein
MSTTVTSKGQVTIPKNLRDYLGLQAGDQVDFVFADDGSVRLQPTQSNKASEPKGRFAAFIGFRKTGGRTDELMDLLRDYDADKDDPGFR